MRPGGFNAVVESWSTLGVYAKTRMIDHLPKQFTCIMFDRRECGQSGGRVEAVTWQHFVAQGKGLLDHLGIKRAHVMGGCMGCPPVAAFAVAHPDMVVSMVLYLAGRRRQIPAVAATSVLPSIWILSPAHGLDGVVALVKKEGKPFGADPRGGPGPRSSSTTAPSPPPMRRWSPTGTRGSARRCAARCSTATPRRAPSPSN